MTKQNYYPSLAKFMEEVKYQNSNTKDYYYLNRKKRIPIFVYDGLKKSIDKQELLMGDDKCKFVCRGVTCDDNFFLIKYSGISGNKEPWTEAIALKEKDTMINKGRGTYFRFQPYTGTTAIETRFVDLGKIIGEIWLVPPEKLFIIDDLLSLEYTHQRHTERVYLYKPSDKDNNLTTMTCFMWTGINEVWKEVDQRKPAVTTTHQIKPIMNNPLFQGKPVYLFAPPPEVIKNE